ncbi:phosphatase PAP2 family protein [Aureimonas pseudogalii]|uniref:Membrane-associated PAP2 superfamily phosphatase n=1 Tax=Aureimonas pseudogalii TaxID=1744844 RepID=A0A7W6H7I0_9HYPH|nr:phosphatase PAP2 family protein [Aureimonas pseudogalii]MBB3999982.1 membrane-associated PAP2 superfamily phosphatase [Aureimonas pseudogalii]
MTSAILPQAAGPRLQPSRRALAQIRIRAVRAPAEAGRDMARRPVRFLVSAILVASFVFTALPAIDLSVSSWFAGADGGFPLSQDRALLGLRDANRLVPQILLPLLAGLLAAEACRPGAMRGLRPHQALYVLLVYALGSGAIVQGLKALVGRARPKDVLAFGGDSLFTAPWQIAGECMRNCSFPSGEAGSGMALLALAMLLPPARRRAGVALLAVPAIAVSLNRVAFGSHFLSDVVMSWLLVGLVLASLHRVAEHHGAAFDQAFADGARVLRAWLSRRRIRA